MKKRIVSVLLVMALLVPTVTACHDSSKDNQATKDVEATGYNPEEAAKKFDFGELSDEDKNYTIEMGYFNCDHMVGAIIGEKGRYLQSFRTECKCNKIRRDIKSPHKRCYGRWIHGYRRCNPCSKPGCSILNGCCEPHGWITLPRSKQ